MTRLTDVDPGDYRVPSEDIGRILTPALVIFLDKVRSNLAKLVERAGDSGRLRPHVKTSKLQRTFSEIVRVGIRHFKCATTREAGHLLRVLDDESVEGDLLVAYPHVGPSLAELGKLSQAHPKTRLSVLVEDPEAVVRVPEALGIYVDVNCGMNRTGIPMSDRSTILEVAKRSGDRFVGVHHYEGHITAASGAETARREQCFALYARLIELLEELDRAGLRVQEVVTSGTPSFAHALEYPALRALPENLHRVSPGTIVYSDHRVELLDELDFDPAALVLSRVVSHPSVGLVTCDAGSKAIASEAGDPVAYVLGWPNLEAQKPSEEHLPLRVSSGSRPPRGEPLLLFPQHVCPTVNLAEEAVLMEGGRIVDVVPVSARAHDLRVS